MPAGQQHRPLDPGSPAPNFRIPRLAGGVTTLGGVLASSPVLLAFFKVSCPVCQLAFPFLERLHASGKLRIYGVSQNDPEDTVEFNQQFGVTFPTLVDTEVNGFAVSHAFSISSVPTLFLIEADGTISRVVEGWSKRDMEWLAERARAVVFQPGEKVPEFKAG